MHEQETVKHVGTMTGKIHNLMRLSQLLYFYLALFDYNAKTELQFTVFIPDTDKLIIILKPSRVLTLHTSYNAFSNQVFGQLTA